MHVRDGPRSARDVRQSRSLGTMGNRRNEHILDCDRLIVLVPIKDAWACVVMDLADDVLMYYKSSWVSINTKTVQD